MFWSGVVDGSCVLFGLQEVVLPSLSEAKRERVDVTVACRLKVYLVKVCGGAFSSPANPVR
jgi:hypothetical protein